MPGKTHAGYFFFGYHQLLAIFLEQTKKRVLVLLTKNYFSTILLKTLLYCTVQYYETLCGTKNNPPHADQSYQYMIGAYGGSASSRQYFVGRCTYASRRLGLLMA